MTPAEQTIAAEVLARTQKVAAAPQFAGQLGKVTDVEVRLRDDGTYDYLSGPEYMSVASRGHLRRRKVWVVRFGYLNHVAADGAHWTTSLAEAQRTLWERP